MLNNDSTSDLTSDDILDPLDLTVQSDPGAFLSVWDTAQFGITGSSSISLPLESNGTYNFLVDWGDGNSNTITQWNQPEVNHTYGSSGIYQVNITGTLIGWCFNNGGDKQKIIGISQWGNLQLGNSGSYFYGASNLQLNATDAPDLTSTTDLSRAFYSCSKLGGFGNMNTWDVSAVTNMNYMFYNTGNFNQSIGSWDVSSVTSMSGMFYGATDFNQPLGDWNVSSVTVMSYMFGSARNFNQPIGMWDVSSVTLMHNMFQIATAFNQPLGDWDVSSVIRMRQMFSSASSFNQPLGNWNVSQVTDMSYMFSSAINFDQTLGNWNISNVSSLTLMFLTTFLSTQNYDDMLIKWAGLPKLPLAVDFSGMSSSYSPKSAPYRQYIIDTYYWTMGDLGIVYNPLITGQGDSSIVESTSGNLLTWTITSIPLTGLSYNITRNGTTVTPDTPWTSGSITLNIDGLNPGVYVYTINVFDVVSIFVSDTVIITVLQKSPVVTVTETYPPTETITETTVVVSPTTQVFEQITTTTVSNKSPLGIGILFISLLGLSGITLYKKRKGKVT